MFAILDGLKTRVSNLTARLSAEQAAGDDAAAARTAEAPLVLDYRAACRQGGAPRGFPAKRRHPHVAAPARHRVESRLQVLGRRGREARRGRDTRKAN